MTHNNSGIRIPTILRQLTDAEITGKSMITLLLYIKKLERCIDLLYKENDRLRINQDTNRVAIGIIKNAIKTYRV